MSTALENQLRNRLKSGEIIGVDSFMATALLDPDEGYYTTKTVFGAHGDFITAPEISQIFGELLAAYITHHATQLPRPLLVELGPGRGTLMHDMLRSFVAMQQSSLFESAYLVEASPKLIALQQSRLASSPLPIHWLPSPEALPEKPCIIIANEWLDALPIRQFVYQPPHWVERQLTLTGEQLSFTTAQTPTPPELIQHLLPPAPPRPGDVLEYPQAAAAALTQLTQHIGRFGGAIILIDYGYNEYAFGDSLQAVHSHAYCPLTEHIGHADITAHVNMAYMRDIALGCGLHLHTLTTQGAFLRQLGAELRTTALCARATPAQRIQLASGLERLIAPQHMGELFKVLVVAHPDQTVLNLSS